MEDESLTNNAINIFGNKNDHKILNAALSLKISNKKSKIVLVSKDINLRLKAKALNITAEDFETGKIDRDSTLYNGKQLIDKIDSNFINKLYKNGLTQDLSVLKNRIISNGFYIMKNRKKFCFGLLQST